MPGNGCWEALYNACPDAKVILTVRQSDEVWFKSVYGFMHQNGADIAHFNYGGTAMGLAGPKMGNMDYIGNLRN